MTSVGTTPRLPRRRGAEAVPFYQAVFGARELFGVEDSDGAVVARLALDPATLRVADESPPHQTFNPETPGGATTRLILVVGSATAVHVQALAAGARQVLPVQQAHGWLVGPVVGSYGHHREIGKPLEQGVGE